MAVVSLSNSFNSSQQYGGKGISILKLSCLKNIWKILDLRDWEPLLWLQKVWKLINQWSSANQFKKYSWLQYSYCNKAQPMVFHWKTMQKGCKTDSSPASSEVITHFIIDFKSTNFILNTNKSINKYYGYIHECLGTFQLWCDLLRFFWSTQMRWVFRWQK